MSLLNLAVSNCAFNVDLECLEENERWFIEKILKRSSTMKETRTCIKEFNHQLEVVKRMKRRISMRDSCGDQFESGVNKNTNSNNNVEGEAKDTEVDLSPAEDSTSMTELPEESSDIIEYGVGYAFQRFFQIWGMV